MVACEEAFGTFPVPICHEWNTVAHLNQYEGRPESRAFTRAELQSFLDYADEQVDRAVKAGRKGALAAYRDATVFKVVYGWGLRRTETAKLDVVDWARNPHAPKFGRYGSLSVRYGKAKRGQPPRRRTVLSVMDWAVDAVGDYVENVRPRFGLPEHPALWVTERRGRIKPVEINARFVAYRDALRLPQVLTLQQPAPFVCDAPDRGGHRPSLHSGAGRPRVRQLHGDLHARQRRLHELGVAGRSGTGVRGGSI